VTGSLHLLTSLKITDMLFTTRGPAPGAIVVEWNIHDPSGRQAASGAWDTIIRVGGAAGTNLLASNCVKGSQNAACMGAFLGLHIKSGATAYLEVCAFLIAAVYE